MTGVVKVTKDAHFSFVLQSGALTTVLMEVWLMTVQVAPNHMH